jgi:hypothetical protein
LNFVNIKTQQKLKIWGCTVDQWIYTFEKLGNKLQRMTKKGAGGVQNANPLRCIK